MGVSGAGVYFFFATMMILSICFVWYTIPETKSIPLEAVDRLFEIKPVRKAHAVVLAEVRAEYHAVGVAKDVDGEHKREEKPEVVHVEDSG